MENLLFDKIIADYHQYVKQFDSSPELSLKYHHSRNVADIAKKISEFQTLANSTLQLVEIAALYHDIGRYTQFEKYKTFNDSLSENHAELGLNIIQELGFLDELDDSSKKIIVEAIRNHNRKTIDESLDEVTTVICNIVRDADKVDILKILADYYQKGVYDPALSLNLPENETYNPQIVQDILSAKLVDLSLMKSVNDFRLVTLSWVFDLNFAVSHILVSDSKALSIIYHSITVKSPEIDFAFHVVEGICEAYSF